MLGLIVSTSLGWLLVIHNHWPIILSQPVKVEMVGD